MSNEKDNKLKQLQLQHHILTNLNRDNGVSCHFDYHINLNSDTETVKLNLLTYNPRHNEYMLFHTVKGASSLDCLEKLMDYISNQRKSNQLKSFTIEWNRKSDIENKHKSYFYASSEEDALQKFLHEKDSSEYQYTIFQNPLS
jgi:hypothetical protein